jgi:uncharacterized protein involved in cysteine biosynthesis
MLAAFAKAIGQLPDPTFRRVLVRSLLLSILVFIALAVVAGFFLQGMGALTIFGWTLLGTTQIASLGILFTFFATGWLLFPAVSSMFIGIFLDDIVEAVERRHYPGHPPGRSLAFGPSLAVTGRFTIALIVLNFLALIVYGLFFWLPIVAPVVYFTINGYLLGREYFELVATRHHGANDARALRRANRVRVFVAGVVVSVLFWIPVVAFLAPLIAAAAMVHVYKGLRE